MTENTFLAMLTSQQLRWSPRAFVCPYQGESRASPSLVSSEVRCFLMLLCQENYAQKAHRSSERKSHSRPALQPLAAFNANPQTDASTLNKRPGSAPATRSKGLSGPSSAGGGKSGVAIEYQGDTCDSAPSDVAGMLGAEREGAAGTRSSLSSSFGGSRVAAGSSVIIRPAVQTYGRTARRADPVTRFQKTQQAWKHAPAVTAGGTSRSSVGHIASLQVNVDTIIEVVFESDH
jgi:hypothetical protein